MYCFILIMNLRPIAITTALMLALAASAVASPIEYTSRAAFDAASTTTLIDFEAQNPGGANGINGSYSSLTIGDVTFSQPNTRLFVLGSAVYNTYGSSYLNHNDLSTGNVTITFANAVTAMGFDLGYLYPWNGNGNLMLTLSNGDVFSIDHNELVNFANPFSFWGVTTETAFTWAVIDDPTKGTAIDNFAFGANSAVPDGGSILGLFGAALAALAVIRRRQA